MDTIEKKISNLVERQFPAHYRENGPVLVAFIVEYYKWLESEGQTLFHTRRLLDYKDIDATADEFILYFKNKYLTDIQFNTSTNIKQIIKHSLDLYRSKGTERAVDLLFRLIFGVGAEVYYPGTDVFKTSDGKWKVPRYLEVIINENNKLFSNKQITGLSSGATAFVEKVIRRTVSNRLIDVLYISSINGSFQTEEVIIIKDDPALIDLKAKIIGSLSAIQIDVNGVGTGYAVGDIVNLKSNKGDEAKGRVANTTNVSGIVSFTLENGGYGYNGNAEVIISEKVLNVSNVHVDANNNTNNYFKLFETFTQPFANITYSDLNGDVTIPTGTLIYTYHPNNDVMGSGIVLSTTATSITDGQIRAAIYSGNLDSSVIYSTSNVISANLVLYVDKTATANIIGVSNAISFDVIGITGVFNKDDIVYQLNSNNDTEVANAVVVSFTTSVGSNGIIKVSNSQGIFRNNLLIRKRNDTISANIQSTSLNIGVFDISNAFISTPDNYFVSSNTFSNGTVSVVSTGTEATFNISPDVLYTETLLDINTDYIRDYANLNLEVLTYQFPGNTAANLISGTIGDALTIENIDIGKIRALINLNTGTDYSIAPFVLIYQPEIETFKIKDNILGIIDVNGNFEVGELVEQSSTGARGIIKQGSNDTTLFMERLRFYDANNFTVTSGVSSQIYGVSSGFIANVVSVSNDNNSKFLGLNAVVFSNTVIGNGSITSMDIVDSGFGFIDGEEITFENNNGIASGISVVKTGGKGEGFYQQKGGFLSDQKKIFDGNYYQDYSYDVLSSITLDKYEEMLKSILHVAGTKYFASFVYKSISNTEINIKPVGISKSMVEQLVTEVGDYLVTETENVLETES